MKTLPSLLAIEKNKLYTDSSWLILLDITFTDSTVLNLVRNTENITWKGTEYTAFPFELEAIANSGKGELPLVQLSVSNVTRIIQGYLEPLNGGVGSLVVFHVVNSEYLSEDSSALDMSFVVLSVNLSASWAVFSLGAPSPIRRRFPLIRYIANHCNWQFMSAECAYSGSIPSTGCDRTFDNCRLFNNTKRFGGYPGINSSGVRFV
jgi:lambda family phage minor tail protein L